MARLQLIVAEKPSVGRDIARVVGARHKRDGYLEGGGYWVSWCVGHLAELCEPHEYDPVYKSWSPSLLPIAPASFRLRPTRARAAAAQLRVLRRLLRAGEVAGVINACDAGREGELIFRYVYELVGCSKPVRRLWISSLTEPAIRAGMAGLRPAAALDHLADAARCRAEADWLVGMNATRGLTGLCRRAGGDGLMSVGRVQTPTLALIVRRDQAIEAFVSEPFWQVEAAFEGDAPALRYVGLWHRPQTAARRPGGERDERDQPSRLGSRAEAEAIVAAVRGRSGVVAKVEQMTERERPPLLFDLTNLQKRANQRYGMSAQATLAAAQALYERHKAITYPRTDARHLSSDLAPELPRVLASLEAGYPELSRRALERAARPGVPGRRVIDDAEVGDHHAIIPTGAVVALERLGVDERKVFDLVARRLLAAFLEDATFAKTRIETRVGEHQFVTKGRVCVEPGWQRAEPPPRRRGEPPALPAVAEGASVKVDAIEVREGATQPPKPYTEASLLAAMERADKLVDEAALRRALRERGLGTPATRAAIIENLLARRYLARRGRELRATAQGAALIAALPVDDLASAELTGDWEQRLAKVARGELSRAAFMAEVRGFVGRAVSALAAADPAAVTVAAPEPLGICPVCGAPVTAGFKRYRCATRGCAFVVHARIAGRAISPALVQVLLAKRRSQPLRGFRSKAGKRFAAALALGDDGKVELVFGAAEAQSRGETRPRSGPARSEASSTAGRRSTPASRGERSARGPRCPACRAGKVIAGRRGWGCSRWRDGCDFVVAFEQRGLRVPDDEAERLFRRGQTRLMPGLGDAQRGRLVLDLASPGNVRVEPAKRRGRAPA